MRRLLIHLAVALVAFTVGVALAAAFGVSLTHRTKRGCGKSVYMAAPPPPPPSFKKSCPNTPRFEALPAPPAPPAEPAAPKKLTEKRVRVRRDGNTVEVIELQTEAPAAKRF